MSTNGNMTVPVCGIIVLPYQGISFALCRAVYTYLQTTLPTKFVVPSLASLRSFVRSFVCSFASFVRSFVRSFLRSFVPSFVRSFAVALALRLSLLSHSRKQFAARW